MAHGKLVTARIEDGRQLLAELDRAGFNIAIAAWVKQSDSNSWRLWIASSSYDPAKRGDATELLHECLQRLPTVDYGIFSSIQFVAESHPTAQSALAIRKRWPDRAPILWSREEDGYFTVNAVADEMYIYPPAGLMSLDDVLRTVAGMLNRQGTIPHSEITLTDGQVLRATPSGLNQLRPGGAVRVSLFDASGNTVEVPAENIAKIY